MGLLNFRGGLAGLGQATEQVGFEQLKAATMAQRDARLQAYQAQRDDKMMAHRSSERVAGQDFQRAMETEVKQPFDLRRDETKRDHDKELQRNEHDTRERLSEMDIEARRDLEGERQRFTAGENKQDRALREKGLQFEAARLGLAQKQFGLAQQQTQLAIEGGKLDLEDKKQIHAIKTSVANAKTPDELEAASAKLYAILAKEGVKMQRTTDELGRQQDMPISDRTGQPIRQKQPDPRSSGAKWDSSSGDVLLDGRVVGKAKDESQARQLIQRARAGSKRDATEGFLP